MCAISGCKADKVIFFQTYLLKYLNWNRSGKVEIPQGSGGAKAGQPLTDPNLTMIAGDVTKPADVAKVFEAGSVDGVVVALGGKTSDVGDTMLTVGTQNVIDAMKKNDVKRMSVVTSIGAGDSKVRFFFF